MSKKIFLTGAAGLIGRNLTAKLVANGYEIVCFDLGEQLVRQKTFFKPMQDTGRVRVIPGTILDKVAMTTAMAGSDAVFHLAAMLGVKRTEDHLLRCLDININGTDNMLDSCVRNRVERVVFASSSEVYGEPSENPIKETAESKGKTVYAVSKLAGEELIKGYSQVYPWLKNTIVRFFNTYGEGQVAQFVMTKWIRLVLAGKNPVVYGSGDQLRSYGHVDDVTDGLVAVLESEKTHGGTYNIGNSSQIYSLRDLAQKIIDVLAPDSGLEVEILDGFAGSDRIENREIFTRYCDTSRVERDLGYSPKISVEEGIRRIAAQDQIHADWPFDP